MRHLLSFGLGLLLTGCGIGLFNGIPVDETRSSIAVTGPLIADGSVNNSLRITLRSAKGQPVAGVIPRIHVSGYQNTLVQTCQESGEDGISLCPNAFGTTVSETKLFSLSTNLSHVNAQATFAARERGHTLRSCGFDMNRNGTIGEEADCRVCDGTTTDPDGDGVDEDMVYIDSINGNDGTATGAPSAPYRTIAAAMAAADGPGDGAEEIYCLSGVFHESVTFPHSGVAGTYNIDGFQFPHHPVMFVGWDKNGNGVYPPVDTEDVAELDGENTRSWAFDLAGTPVSRVEVAHLTIRRYQDQAAAGGGVANLQNDFSHINFHDLTIREINETLPDNNVVASRAVFTPQNNNDFQHFAFTQSNISRTGANFLNIWNDTYGDYVGALIKNNSIEMTTPPNQAELLGVKGVDQYIVRRNRFSFAAPAGWDFDTLNNHYHSLINIYGCSTNMTISENEATGFGTSVLVSFLGVCAPSVNTDNLVIDSNNFVSGFAGYNHIFVNNPVHGGTTSNQTNTMENLQITNNYFLNGRGQLDTCIRLQIGNSAGANPGTVVIAGNTCAGPFANDALTLSTETGGPPLAFPQMNFRVWSNIFDLSVGSSAGWLMAESQPTGWQSNGNIFSGASHWTWGGVAQATLADWRTASGNQDLTSRVCSPTYVNLAGHDAHLASSDTCATKSGVDVTSITTRDYDGDTRPAVTDSGADHR